MAARMKQAVATAIRFKTFGPWANHLLRTLDRRMARRA
jgi:hypothetical protein